jgi:rSAM/selenodomain-associated transferase 2/rSAM/selenodomain-associated transferase 1
MDSADYRTNQTDQADIAKAMTDQRRRLILFARYPVAGRVKTRLIPALGAEGAAALHRRLLLRTLRTASAACRVAKADLEIHFDGGSERALQHWLGDGWRYVQQGEGDLGPRMARAFERSFRDGATQTVIIGSDCPTLTTDSLVAAFDCLSTTPAVLGPANDGGYYLIGLSKPVPELFQDIAWGTETVFTDSVRRLEQVGIKPSLLSPLDDLDRPEDLPVWKRITQMEEADLGRVSVIIPALNEAERIAASIRSAHQVKPHEIIVVDGCSADDTVQRAREAGATVIHSAPSRARQMNAGAASATGSVLLFLHADTRLPCDYLRAVSETLCQPQVVAGAFRFRIDGDFLGKQVIEWGTNLRSRLLQMPYGDQTLFLRRAAFENLGGFADLPIMEDYELVRRLRCHGRLVTVEPEAVTSDRRWRRAGVLRTTLTHLWMVIGYHLGWPMG